MSPQRPEVNVGLAYLTWALGVFGACGVHRFYMGRPISGIIWLFTLGLFGFGQLIDLFLIPGMAKERNRYLWERVRTDSSIELVDIGRQMLSPSSSINRLELEETKPIEPLHKLLEVALANGGVLTTGQAMLATGLSLEKVEELLKLAMHQGIAEVENHPDTGKIRYRFDV